MSSTGPFGLVGTLLPGTGLKVRYPAFSDDDRSYAGLMRVYQLGSLVESFMAIYNHQILLNYHLLRRSDGITCVVKRSDYQISPEFYTMTHNGHTFPFSIIGYLKNARRSSFQLDLSLYTEDYPTNRLMKCTITVVLVSLELKMPVELPGELQKKIGRGRAAVNRGSFPAIPEKVHWCDIEVQPRDIDQNLHANQTSYLRFCDECALDAQRKDFFDQIDGFEEYPVQVMEAVYSGECREGDVLRV